MRPGRDAVSATKGLPCTGSLCCDRRSSNSWNAGMLAACSWRMADCATAPCGCVQALRNTAKSIIFRDLRRTPPLVAAGQRDRNVSPTSRQNILPSHVPCTESPAPEARRGPTPPRKQNPLAVKRPCVRTVMAGLLVSWGLCEYMLVRSSAVRHLPFTVL